MVYILKITITRVPKDFVHEPPPGVEGQINTNHIETIVCYDGILRNYLVNVSANTLVLSTSVKYLLVKSLKKLSYFLKNHNTSVLTINQVSLSTELDATGEICGDSIDVYVDTSYSAININHTSSASKSVPAKNISVKLLAIALSDTIIQSYTAATSSCWT